MMHEAGQFISAAQHEALGKNNNSYVNTKVYLCHLHAGSRRCL